MPEHRSKTSTVPVVWGNLEFFQHDPNDFLSRLVTMDETCLYHYGPETKQQSVEWRHSSSPRLNKFWVQKSAGKILASIFWDQDGILLIDYLPKGPTINTDYYSSLLVQLKDILKEKRCGKVTKRVLFLPRLTVHLQPGRNWPTWASIVLITHPILWIWPRRTITCSVVWKNNWNFGIFRPTRRSQLPRRPGWTDKLLTFFLILFFLVACIS